MDVMNLQVHHAWIRPAGSPLGRPQSRTPSHRKTKALNGQAHGIPKTMFQDHATYLNTACKWQTLDRKCHAPLRERPRAWRSIFGRGSATGEHYSKITNVYGGRPSISTSTVYLSVGA